MPIYLSTIKRQYFTQILRSEQQHISESRYLQNIGRCLLWSPLYCQLRAGTRSLCWLDQLLAKEDENKSGYKIGSF